MPIQMIQNVLYSQYIVDSTTVIFGGQHGVYSWLTVYYCQFVGTTSMPNIMQAHKFEMVLHFNGETKRKKVESIRSVSATIADISSKFHAQWTTSEDDETITSHLFSNGIYLQVFQLA